MSVRCVLSGGAGCVGECWFRSRVPAASPGTGHRSALSHGMVSLNRQSRCLSCVLSRRVPLREGSQVSQVGPHSRQQTERSICGYKRKKKVLQISSKFHWVPHHLPTISMPKGQQWALSGAWGGALIHSTCPLLWCKYSPRARVTSNVTSLTGGGDHCRLL